jgi:hypothetical protein
MCRAAREAGAHAEQWKNGAGLSSRHGLQSVWTSGCPPRGGVHLTALAVRLSQRVATMAQCSTSASMIAREGMLRCTCVEEKEMFAVCANYEIGGKVLGQNLQLRLCS